MVRGRCPPLPPLRDGARAVRARLAHELGRMLAGMVLN